MGDKLAAEPRPAATSVIVRSGRGGAELLFVRRPASMRFLGGFHAFPGGALDPADYSDEAAAISALAPEEAEGQMRGENGPYPALGFFVCALREIFEEVGILYAHGPEPLPDALRSARQRLISGGESFPEIVSGLGLQLATDKLRFLVRWVAPSSLPVRFDARVFVAPSAGDPDPDPREVDAVDWLTPSEALAMAESGVILMAPPTAATVSSLMRFDSVESILSGSPASSLRGEVEPLSPLVRRIVAPNPSIMTGPGTNTYLVGGDELMVVDPGSMEHEHLSAVAAAGKIAAIVVTHNHADHFSGAMELAEKTGATIYVSRGFGRSDLDQQFRRVGEGDLIDAGGVRLRVIETPGHASDHICLWLEEERALFSGDLVLGEGTTVISPPDGNLTDYLDSLDRVAQLPIDVLYPGHFGPRRDALELIAWYVSHRGDRENQILEAIAEGAATVGAIVDRVYESYPKALHPVAERSVVAHLEKLFTEGRIRESRGSYFLVP